MAGRSVIFLSTSEDDSEEECSISDGIHFITSSEEEPPVCSEEELLVHSEAVLAPVFLSFTSESDFEDVDRSLALIDSFEIAQTFSGEDVTIFVL